VSRSATAGLMHVAESAGPIVAVSSPTLRRERPFLFWVSALAARRREITGICSATPTAAAAALRARVRERQATMEVGELLAAGRAGRMHESSVTALTLAG
jgi:hypothetical protein